MKALSDLTYYPGASLLSPTNSASILKSAGYDPAFDILDIDIRFDDLNVDILFSAVDVHIQWLVYHGRIGYSAASSA